MVVAAIGLITPAIAYIWPHTASPSRVTEAGTPETKALAVSTVWPTSNGCANQQVAMPVGTGSINDFHAGSDTVKELIAHGGGVWISGMLAIDLSAAPGKSVAIQRIIPHIDRRDLAAPAWIYSPNFGCGPNSADRHIVWKLDSAFDDFRDEGVAAGAAGPSNGTAPTAAFGPDFVLSGKDHARIRVDTYACRGNYQWRLDVEYTETGRSGVQSFPVGPYLSFGLANNTTDYHAGWDASGHAAIKSQTVLTGAAAEIDNQNDCTPTITPSISNAPKTSQPPTPSASDPLLSRWVGHGRSLQLAPGGSGTLTLASGASTDEVWTVTWNAQGAGRVLITLANRTSSRGGGVGLNEGEQYIAALQTSPLGEQLLHFVKSTESVDDPSRGFFFCTPAQQARPQSPCGA
ncbi:hypothetical protein [Mycobacterium conspicuum]|uniref:hypothetical protein n=1 Tax=Mycobacterium conspicuum TaxID=44010 RepID=UPI0013D43BBB|nr:hypothetical protein [Mycobacterium conspicuum]